jgi:hypothetical protein
VLFAIGVEDVKVKVKIVIIKMTKTMGWDNMSDDNDEVLEWPSAAAAVVASRR